MFRNDYGMSEITRTEIGHILYDYTKTRLSRDKVTLNRLVDVQSLPNHLSEIVEKGSSYGTYWIF